VSDAEALYLLAVVVYLAETCMRVPRDASGVQRAIGRWRRLHPIVLRGGAGPALVVPAPLMPPLGLVALGRQGGSLVRAEALARVRAFAQETQALRFYTTMTWLVVFGGGALLVWWPHMTTWSVLAPAAVMWLGIVTEAIRLQRAAPRHLRVAWTDLIVTLASPLSAMRAHDVLARPAFVDLDPVALAAAVLPREVAAQVVGRALARSRVFGQGDGPALEALARDAGLDPQVLLAAPSPEGPSALSFCPICRAQFVLTTGRCEDCGGVALASLDDRRHR